MALVRVVPFPDIFALEPDSPVLEQRDVLSLLCSLRRPGGELQVTGVGRAASLFTIPFLRILGL